MKTENIGKNLKEIIVFLDITQVEAAKRCNMTPAAISQIINGERIPSVDSVYSILKAFNIKFERLLK
jgi:transcriptional regulator with XRE-family HTH domain